MIRLDRLPTDEPKAGSAPCRWEHHSQPCTLPSCAPVEKAGGVEPTFRIDGGWTVPFRAYEALRAEHDAAKEEIEERIGRGVRTYEKLCVLRGKFAAAAIKAQASDERLKQEAAQWKDLYDSCHLSQSEPPESGQRRG